MLSLAKSNNSILLFFISKQTKTLLVVTWTFFQVKSLAFLQCFQLIAKIHFLLFNETPTEEQTEECAKAREEFLKIYPVLFPDSDITRKMFVISMILPIFIRREKAKTFKFISAEEQGETLHKLFNELERQYCSIRYKPGRYLSMKKAYVNRIS